MNIRLPLSIDLNCDVGESFGRWTLGDDATMLRHITSANVACGMHAGDYATIDQLVAMAKDAGVAVGAHPGYTDLQGFGRREVSMSSRELEQLVLYQIGAVYGFCRAHHVDLTHVKPHGALYNRAAVDLATARAIAVAVARFSRELPLVGLAGSVPFSSATVEAGLTFVPEAFADRRYNPDGTLQSRSVPASILSDPAEASEQAARIVLDHQVRAHDGSTVQVVAASLCFHGDTLNAPAVVAAARKRLVEAGVSVKRFVTSA